MATWQRAGAATIALVVAMSPVGYQMLKSHEGLGQPGATVQKAYADPYYGWRVATICYGHTASVKQGDTATMQQCDQFLRDDVTKHCALVYDALIPHGIGFQPRPDQARLQDVVPPYRQRQRPGRGAGPVCGRCPQTQERGHH